MPVSSLRPSDPATIGRYVLLGRVAAGGMGIVYLGREDGRPDSLVVVKTTRPDLGVPAAFVDRLRSEALITAALADGERPVEGLARFVEADAQAERPWIATEYVPGPCLHEVARGHGVADDVVAALAVSLAETIAALHRAGVAHRDVKPANIVLGPDGARLVDLGLARRVGAPYEPRAMGSPGWSPPEQHDAGADPRPGDVHGWAMSVAYAACGRPAFGTGPSALVTRRMLTGEPRLTGLPERLRPLVTAALRPDPLSRPKAEDVVDGLASAPWLSLVPPVLAVRPAASAATLVETVGDAPDATRELAPPTLVEDGPQPERRAPGGVGLLPVRRPARVAMAAGALLVLGAVALGHVVSPAPAGADAPGVTRPAAAASPTASASRSSAPSAQPTPVAPRTAAPQTLAQHGKGKHHKRKH